MSPEVRALMFRMQAEHDAAMQRFREFQAFTTAQYERERDPNIIDAEFVVVEQKRLSGPQ